MKNIILALLLGLGAATTLVSQHTSLPKHAAVLPQHSHSLSITPLPPVEPRLDASLKPTTTDTKVIAVSPQAPEQSVSQAPSPSVTQPMASPTTSPNVPAATTSSSPTISVVPVTLTGTTIAKDNYCPQPNSGAIHRGIREAATGIECPMM